VNVIFHCAAASGRPPKKELYEANYRGVKNLLEGMSTEEQVRLVYVSGLSVLGIRHLRPATEDMPWRRSGEYAANIKIEAEKLILDHHRRLGRDAVILRPAIVYGPGDENLSQVLQAVREGKFAYIGSRNNIIPMVHVEDFVQAMQLAAGEPQANGRTYHITDGSETTIGEIVDYLADLSGSPRPKLVLPYFIPYAGCLLFQSLRALRLWSAPPPIEWASLRFLGTSRSVPIARAQRELGFSPRFSFREGLAASFRKMEEDKHESLRHASAPA
jgi:nucleoside-diphosphate-sugar epimerase